jgi:hypothetical protein
LAIFFSKFWHFFPFVNLYAVFWPIWAWCRVYEDRFSLFKSRCCLQMLIMFGNIFFEKFLTMFWQCLTVTLTICWQFAHNFFDNALQSCDNLLTIFWQCWQSFDNYLLTIFWQLVGNVWQFFLAILAFFPLCQFVCNVLAYLSLMSGLRGPIFFVQIKMLCANMAKSFFHGFFSLFF